MIHLIIGCGICIIFNVACYISIIKPMDTMLDFSGKRQIRLKTHRRKIKNGIGQKKTFLVTFILTLITAIIVVGFVVAQIVVWCLCGDGKEIEIVSDIALAMTVVNGFICSCFYDSFAKHQNEWLLARHEQELNKNEDIK